MEINCALFVKHVFPHPGAGRHFPCYIAEKGLPRPMRYQYSNYISTISAIEGQDWESFEIKHTIEAVHGMTDDDIGRYTKEVIKVLHMRLSEIIASRGGNISGQVINFKFYKESFKAEKVHKAIKELQHKRLMKLN